MAAAAEETLHRVASCAAGAGVGGAVGGRLERARQVDVEVLDFGLAAAVPKFPGEELRKTARAFPDQGQTDLHSIDEGECAIIWTVTSMTPSEPGAAENNRIKVWYRFVPREGWLPYDTEGLWATRLSGDTARVENIPFLQNGVAEGDIVRFVTDTDGLYWAKERVEASEDCTIRVLPVASGPLGRSARAVHERLSPFGLGGEVFSDEFPLVAFTVPADADIGGIKALLIRGQEDGWWHFEVACATDAWRDA